MRILFKYTTRGRRDNFLRGIDSIINNIEDKENYHILISVENAFHDHKMHPLPVLNCPHTYKVNPDAPTTKIDAINRDVNEFDYDWDIIINMSDDMVFHSKGFDNVIRSYFKEDWGIDTYKSLLFFDGNRSDIITMSILGRKYYDRDKYIYHPSYKSVYCDNEATDVAKMRGVLIECKEHLFTHHHPSYGKGNMDAQYVHTESFYAVDEQNYFNRRMKFFRE